MIGVVAGASLLLAWPSAAVVAGASLLLAAVRRRLVLDPHITLFAGFTAVYAGAILAVSTLEWIDPLHDRLLVPLVTGMILALL